MSYVFASHLLLREPVRTPVDYAGSLQSFLDNPHFRSALFLASGTFYAGLAKKEFSLGRLTDRETNTLRKYVNRFCFRPTPFGLFASVSLADWLQETGTVNNAIRLKWYSSAGMAYKNLVAKQLADSEQLQETLYEKNPSIYRVINEYRFFRMDLHKNGRHRLYQLQSIAFSKLLKDLISFCEGRRPKKDIVAHIATSAACNEEEALDYTGFLIDSQVLVNCQRMNVTGKELLLRYADISLPGNTRSALREVLDQLSRLQPDGERNSTEGMAAIQQKLKTLLPGQQGTDFPELSVILQREKHGSLEQRYQEKLKWAIDALWLLSPSEEVFGMTQFVDAYQKHFEGQRLPLMLALDPEAGIGYQQPAKQKNNPLLETLNIAGKRTAQAEATWSATHSVLLGAWLRDRSPLPVIDIQSTDLAALSRQTNQNQLLGMSVLFRIFGNEVFIESAGGINAPALFGRFTGYCIRHFG